MWSLCCKMMIPSRELKLVAKKQLIGSLLKHVFKSIYFILFIGNLEDNNSNIVIILLFNFTDFNQNAQPLF